MLLQAQGAADGKRAEGKWVSDMLGCEPVQFGPIWVAFEQKQNRKEIAAGRR